MSILTESTFFLPASLRFLFFSSTLLDSARLGVIFSFVLARPLPLTHGLCNLIPTRRPPRNPFGESYLHSLKSSGEEKNMYREKRGGNSRYSALFHRFTLSVWYYYFFLKKIMEKIVISKIVDCFFPNWLRIFPDSDFIAIRSRYGR